MAKVPYSHENAIAARLRFARSNLDLSQKDLSARAGINPRRYSKYELGDNVPPPDVLMALCRALNVSSDFLLGLSDDYERGVGSAAIAPAGDYICLTGADGSRHMYTIPADMRDRVSSMLMAAFPEIMKDREVAAVEG